MRSLRGQLPLALVACSIGLAFSMGCSEGKSPHPPEDLSTSAPAPRASREAGTPTKTRSPNLLLITLDTVRADALGAYGQPRPTTPEIDRLAREGVLFEQAATTQPETLPAHSTIFTGKWPFAHGVRANGGFVLSERHVTLAEALRSEGYATGAEVAAMVLRQETQITQGFDHYRGADTPGVEHRTIRYTAGPVREETKPIRPATDITKSGIEFVRKHQEHEFFLWVHYFDAHMPYSAPAIFNHKIQGSPYHAEVASADSQVGRLILEIERLGLRDDTIVVLTADHGEGLGDHGEPSHSYFVYESTLRVPLILWGPRTLPAGLRIESPVRTMDIAPTVLALLGKPPLEGVQGVSLAGLITGDATDLSLASYSESTRFTATFSLPTLRSIRKGRWKYIHKVNPELYDLEVDPGELVNRFDTEPDVARSLREELGELLVSAPAKPTDAQAKIDAETAAQLIALGYVARSPKIEVVDDVESLALSDALGDPVDLISEVEALTEALGLIGREMWGAAYERLAPIAELHPNSVFVLTLTARALLGLERSEEAVVMLRHALMLEPEEMDVSVTLAKALAAQGEGVEAATILSDILAADPCNEAALLDLSAHLRDQKRYRELIDATALGLRQCPDMLMNANNHAWALATLPEDELRDGVRALEVIEEAIAKTKDPNPAFLDTLAAAYAERGDFEAAGNAARESLALLEALHVPQEIIAEVQQHADAFAAHEPLRVP